MDRIRLMALALTLSLAAGGALLAATPRLVRRVQLSRAKHRSLAGHSNISRRVARLLPAYAYDDKGFFAGDGAPSEVVARRRAALQDLGDTLRRRSPRTLAMSAQARPMISDMQFIGRYRVPFQYRDVLAAHLELGSFVERSEGVQVFDLDGQAYYDLTGSYGVNLLGYDFYKRCIAEGSARAAELGPVLGAYHPSVADVAVRLRRISGLDELSFHMSGTEAVMQAVRLARYHTRRSHVVRFCGAYHGWWDDVQPGIGSPMAARATYTLKDMSDRSLKVLASRTDIACVLVNPLQALHPNKGAPGDSTLVDSSRQAGFARAEYTEWLKRLREVCDARGIVLIFDEVFVGFRLAQGGAQEYFGVRADMVTYGKTLGGGLPVGVLCGKAQFMRRYAEDRPLDVCFARGTFNAHPYVMGAMQVFLEHLDSVEGRAQYADLDERWAARADAVNERLAGAALPVRIANLSTIWTFDYTRPSRYNWMFQFYLRRQGLALSWVGTGRLIFSLNYDDADFAAVVERLVAAGTEMVRDGWWDAAPAISNQSIRRRVTREWLGHAVGGLSAGVARVWDRRVRRGRGEEARASTA